MSEVKHFPISDNATAQEVLTGCSRRPFKSVLVLGVYEDDDELRHISTETRARQLWMLELYKNMLLGLIDGADIPEAPNDG